MLPKCRNVVVNGRRTSVRMEPAMWDALAEICAREGRTLNEICSMVDKRRGEMGLTAALRVFAICFFREATGEVRPLRGLAEDTAELRTPADAQAGTADAHGSRPAFATAGTPSPALRAALDVLGEPTGADPTA